MDKASIDKAADALIAARDSGNKIDRLPEALRPANLTEGNAVQDAVVAKRGDAVCGWKVLLNPEGVWLHGNMLKSRCYESGAEVPSKLMGMLGIEVEIAFRFDKDLPPRATDYTQDEVADAATAIVAIELCDMAFKDTTTPSLFERVGDSLANAGVVVGTVRSDWRKLGDGDLEASLIVNGEVKVKKPGEAAIKKPLHRATGMANIMRTREGVKAGQVVICGSYTGMEFFKPGDKIRGEFKDFGFAEMTFSK